MLFEVLVSSFALTTLAIWKENFCKIPFLRWVILHRFSGKMCCKKESKAGYNALRNSKIRVMLLVFLRGFGNHSSGFLQELPAI